MEIIIAAVVIGLIGYWAYTQFNKEKPDGSHPLDTLSKTPETETQHRVEAPVVVQPAKCGCGRSQTGFCVGLHKLTQEEWSTHEANPNKTPAVETKKKPAAKKAAAPKAPAKPRAKKTAAK